MKQFKVEVLQDGEDYTCTYHVLSSTEDDAMLLAFALDGGLDFLDTIIDKGHLQLAKMYCKIL